MWLRSALGDGSGPSGTNVAVTGGSVERGEPVTDEEFDEGFEPAG